MERPLPKSIAYDGYFVYIVKIEHGIDDYVVWFNSYDPYTMHKTKLYYGNIGDYFKVGGKRRYISEFMRVE